MTRSPISSRPSARLSPCGPAGRTPRDWSPISSARICLSGVEHEELFDEALKPLRTRDNPGEVSGFAPPGASTVSATSATRSP